MLASAALVALIPNAPSLARHLLRLSLTASHNPPPSLPPALSIAANNTLHCVWPLLLGFLGAQRRRFTRLLADTAVLANLLLPSILVGCALGGYGARLFPFLPHIPFEWAGVSLGCTGWLVERRLPLGWGERAGAVALTASLLMLAAVCESWLVPHL